MKILIISDSHGNIANLKAVMEIAKKSGIKAVIHCGDWDNKESVETVTSFGIPLYAVLGNADVDSNIEDTLKFQAKKFDPFLLKLNLDGVKIGVIHQANLKNEKLYEFKFVFSGHYHSKEEKMVNFTKFVRPGAIINGINFAVFETTSGTIEFVNEE
ncbi:MAG TPA: metallophosphoesterase family protein [Patescibacteria group bacterium]|nr:metallophosphoesterase family protein [Patescibacteria group bacterium]